VKTGVGSEQCSEASMDDGEEKTRARHHSWKSYDERLIDLKKLGFYPPQWCDVLEKAQKLWQS